jgi:hypothetical protein
VAELSKLAEFLMPEADVVQVRYFTSLIKRRTDDPDAGNRQAVFLRALATLPNLTVHLGHFQRNLVWRRRVDNPAKSVRVIDVKEKGSDVNLAAFLIHDALGGECELAGVMSSDSDLAQTSASPRGRSIGWRESRGGSRIARFGPVISQRSSRTMTALSQSPRPGKGGRLSIARENICS